MKNALKSIAIMLAIILICGGLLAILSDVLYVTDEERIQRAIDKAYTEDVSLSQTLDATTYTENSEVGVIKQAYLLDNGDYLILSTGKQGYSNGTVSAYVAIEVTNGVATVKKVVQDSYTGQTLMSKLTNLYDQFVGNSVDSDFNKIVSGATYSSNATANAVKIAVTYVQSLIGG
jgi:Na+-translocating ferredoxin:NAD+ oxidoreductase RnfG subunit